MKHVLEFNDESANATGKKHDGITFSCSGDELLGKIETNGTPFIFGNGAGLVKLGEILIRIGMSKYKPGFHLHVREDFDGDRGEILIIGVKADGSAT
jgi:hypothetical protein